MDTAATLSEKEIQELPRKLMSLDPKEWIQVLREHSATDCVLDTDDLHTKGVEEIAKVLFFTGLICKDGGVIGQPRYDALKQTITYDYFRKLKIGFKVSQKTVLHLRPAVEADGHSTSTGKLIVTKIGDPGLNMSWTQWPIVRTLYLGIYRSAFTWLIARIAAQTGGEQWSKAATAS